MTQVVTDTDFQTEVLDAEKPVVVDFWAAWCPPCRAIAPIFDELSSEMADKVTFKKMNVDENQKIPQQYSIMSIPTMLVFSKGKAVQRSVGFMPKGSLREKIEAAL